MYTRAAWETEPHVVPMLEAGRDAPHAACALLTPPIVRFGCAAARLALVHVPAGDERPRHALDATEAWAQRRAAREEVARAVRAANAVRVAAIAALDGPATYAAAAAMSAGNSVVFVPYCVNTALAGAISRVGIATSIRGRVFETSQAEANRRMAELVRCHIPWALVAAALVRQRRR